MPTSLQLPIFSVSSFSPLFSFCNWSSPVSSIPAAGWPADLLTLAARTPASFPLSALSIEGEAMGRHPDGRVFQSPPFSYCSAYLRLQRLERILLNSARAHTEAPLYLNPQVCCGRGFKRCSRQSPSHHLGKNLRHPLNPLIFAAYLAAVIAPLRSRCADSPRGATPVIGYCVIPLLAIQNQTSLVHS